MKIHKRIAALCLLMFISLLIPSVFAAEEYSLRIEYLDEGRALGGVAFQLYKVATIPDGRNYVLTEAFSGALDGTDAVLQPVMSNSDWEEVTRLLAACKDDNAVESDLSGYTQTDGTVEFHDMEPGLYLVSGSVERFDSTIYTPQDFCVVVPGRDESDGRTPVYDVVVQPKFEKRTVPPSVPNENTGGLVVMKTVKGAGDKDREWHFSVSLDRKLNGTYGDMTFEDGVARFTLRDGEAATATGLPIGTGYTVREREANQDGYETTVKGNKGKIPSLDTEYADFVNSKEAGEGGLSVSKSVTGDGDKTRDWSFHVSLSEPLSGQFGEMNFINGESDFTLRHGETRTAEGLPEGTEYTVSETEANSEGYTTSYSGATGTIPENDIARAQFTNAFKKDDKEKEEPGGEKPGTPGGNSGDDYSNLGEDGLPTDGRHGSGNDPFTGDNSRIGMWISFMAISLGGFVVLVAAMKENGKDSE